MADNEQKKNSASLGELFVEFGSKGLGGLVKGLNTVSASFLLTKNSAQQIIKPLENMSKQASSSIIAFDKLNSITGISVNKLQYLKQWTTLNNISFNDYVGQIHTLQNALMDLSLGNPGQLTNIASMLGINPMDLNPTKPLESMKKIENAIRRIYQVGNEESKLRASTALRLLGLNEELAYSYTRANREVDKSLLLSDKQQKKLREQQYAWNGLKVASESFFNKLMANAGIFKNFIDGATNAFKNLVAFIDANREKKVDIIFDFGASVIGNLKHFFKGFRIFNNDKTLVNPQDRNFLVNLGIWSADWGIDLTNEALERSGKKPILKSYRDFKVAPPKALQPNAGNISSLTNKNKTTDISYNITINQDITGSNAEEIAYTVSDKIDKTIIQNTYGSDLL